MPPGLQVLLPTALLAGGAGASWLAGAAGLRVGRVAAAASAWAALAALLVLWLPRRSTVELAGPPLGAGVQFGERLDGVGFAFAVALLLPAALLLTFQRRGWAGASAAAAAVAFSLTAILAGSLAVTALAAGAAATVALVPVRSDSELGILSFWPFQVAGSLLLVWSAAALQTATGTSTYAAVPVGAVPTPFFILLAGGALLCAAALPWRGWTSEFWDRPRLVTGSLAIAALVPVAFAVLFRGYEIGGGRWPGAGLNVAVALAGAAAVAGAAARAQAAAVRRPVLGESLPSLAGYALVGIGLGTALGLTAAVSCVLAAGVVAALLPLVPEDRSATSLTGAALAAGLPPGVPFAARLLTIEAALEAGTAQAFLAVLLALAWLLELAATARAVRLPAAGGAAAPAGSLAGSLAALALVLAGGAGFGVVASGLSVPAAAEVVGFPAASITGPPYSVLSASGGWAAAALGIPVVALALLLLPALRTDLVPARRGVPGPFFAIGWAVVARRAYERLAAARIPEEYSSLFNVRGVEAAMARGRPVLWAVLLLVLAVAVNR